MRVVVRVQPPFQAADIPYWVTQEAPLKVDKGRYIIAVGLKQDIVGQEIIMDEGEVGLRNGEAIRERQVGLEHPKPIPPRPASRWKSFELGNGCGVD